MADDLTGFEQSLLDAWLGTSDVTVGGAPIDWNGVFIQPEVAPGVGLDASAFEVTSGGGAGEAGGGVSLPQIQQALQLAAARTPGGLNAVLGAPVFDNVFVDPRTNALVLWNGQPIPPTSDVWKQLDTALGSNLGRVATTLGLGAAGLGVSRLVAGASPTLRLPSGVPTTPAVSAAQAALERTLTGTGAQNLSDLFSAGVAGQTSLAQLLSTAAGREMLTQATQAPGEAAVRMAALGQLPGYLQPAPETAGAAGTTASVTRLLSNYLPQGTSVAGGDGAAMPTSPLVAGATGGVAPLSDPVLAQIEAEIARALAGELRNPEIDRQFRMEEQQLRNSLFQQLGANYELSTAGSMRLQQLRESQDARREAYAMQAVSTLAPIAQARRGFNYQQPLSTLSALLPEERARAAQGEQLQTTGLATRAALSSTLGRPTTGELSTGLSQSVPIQPLLGLGDAAAAQRQREALQAQAAINAFNLEQQDRASLAQGVGGVFGAAAGALTAPRRLLTVGVP